MQLSSFLFFKKTLHFYCIILLIKTQEQITAFSFFASIFMGTNSIRPWKANPPAPPSPAHSSTQYAHSKSQHFKSLAHVKKKNSSFSRKTLISVE